MNRIEYSISDRGRIFTNVAALVNRVGAALLVANENEGRLGALLKENAGAAAAVVVTNVVAVVFGAARRFASALFAMDGVPKVGMAGAATLVVAGVENEIGALAVNPVVGVKKLSGDEVEEVVVIVGNNEANVLGIVCTGISAGATVLGGVPNPNRGVGPGALVTTGFIEGNKDVVAVVVGAAKDNGWAA